MRKQVLCLALAAIVSLGGCAKAPAGQGSAAPDSAEKTEASQASAPSEKPSEEKPEAESNASEAESNASEAAPEESYEMQGKAGENVNWYYKAGVLTFKGTGDMSEEMLALFEEDSDYAAIGEKVTKVVIEQGVTSICDFAFSNSMGNWQNLSDVTIPDSVTSIGFGAFVFCENLKDINLPDSVTEIGGGAFVGCGFDEETINKINEKYPTSCPFDSSVFQG